MASNDKDGVWRTVGGRRIFIKDGEDLASAMKKSGKFKNSKKKEEPDFLKNATDEEKENYYKNMAEKEKMQKMGTTAYLQEKQREKGNYQDEKTNSLQKKANEIAQKLKENKTSDEKASEEESKRIKEKEKYRQYYEKEKLGEPSNYQKGAKVLVQDSYSGKYDTEYTVVREATINEKSGKVNTNLKAYVLKDKDGNEIIKADTRIKTSESSKTEAKNYMQDQFKAFDKGNISGADLEKAKRDSGLSKQEIEEARNYVNNRAPESYPRQTENKTGKTTSQAVPKTSKTNDWVRNAFNDYKKEHPNTKMTLEQFKKSKK